MASWLKVSYEMIRRDADLYLCGYFLYKILIVPMSNWCREEINPFLVIKI
jgi:hypothetical protein